MVSAILVVVHGPLRVELGDLSGHVAGVVVDVGDVVPVSCS